MATMAPRRDSSEKGGPTEPGGTLNDARNLVLRLQRSEAFGHYLRRRKQLVFAALLVLLWASLGSAAGLILLATGSRSLVVLLALLASPFVFMGAAFVHGYVFFSWLENRALARAFPHAVKPAGGPLARFVATRLRADLGAAPPMPWGLAALFVAAPLATLVFLAPKAGLLLLVALAAMPVLYARFDR
jgi:hypothetical protein